jgi:hypothetical protein
MNAEDTHGTATKFVVIIFIGSVLAAVFGGLFGLIISVISPEFMNGISGQSALSDPSRFAFALGMIWGLFIGLAVSGFSCLLAVVIKIIRIRFENK